jgi:uncharacterized damage-inducible protein DinB
VKDRIQKKLARLNEDTAAIYAELEGIPDEKLMDKSYGWSIIQVLSHLNEAESASLKYMQKKMQAGDKMKNARVYHGLRMSFVNVALKSRLKWKAPSYISNPPEYPMEEIKEKWANTRNEIAGFVNDFPDKWLYKLVYKHPMAGRQNLEHAVDSFIYHQIHHTHQIDRIRKQLGI